MFYLFDKTVEQINCYLEAAQPIRKLKCLHWPYPPNTMINQFILLLGQKKAPILKRSMAEIRMAGKEDSICQLAGWLAGSNSSEERIAANLFTGAEPEKQVEQAGWDSDSQEKVFVCSRCPYIWQHLCKPAPSPYFCGKVGSVYLPR